MKNLKTEKLSCVKCPEYDDYLPVKYCIACRFFEGDLHNENENKELIIPCSQDEGEKNDIVEKLMYMKEEDIKEIIEKVEKNRSVLVMGTTKINNEEGNNE